jgi:peroxiredoxin
MNDSMQIPVYREELKTLRQNLAAVAPADVLKVFDQDAAQMAKDFANPLKLSVGDEAPLFELPNAAGTPVSLSQSLAQGHVVLVFYRGDWCPYCNLSLNGYQRVLDQIKALGGNLVAVSPQSPDHSNAMIDKNALAFEVLSDAGNHVASLYTTIFNLPESSNEAGLKVGVDVAASNIDKTVAVPVPAVYIINKNGKIAFAKSEGGDFTQRVEAQEILDALQSIEATG